MKPLHLPRKHNLNLADLYLIAPKPLPYSHLVYLSARRPGLVSGQLLPHGQYRLAVHGPFRCVARVCLDFRLSLDGIIPTK